MSHSAAKIENAPPAGEGESVGQYRPALSLLYHELRPLKSGYTYALDTNTFREHLQLFCALRAEGVDRLAPEITFDDGHVSNFEQALPCLQASGLTARFFVTVGWTSVRREYMEWQQIREMVRCGQRIGAHGWSHKLLTHCSDAELATELDTARQVLEDKLGIGITTISLPGGRFDRRVLEACTRAGYRQVFTSVPQVQTSPRAALVGRINLHASVTVPWLQTLFAPGSGELRKLEFRYRLKDAAQRTLGDGLYMKLWALLNKPEAGDHPA